MNNFYFGLGIPTYFVASLLEMSDWGGTDAASLKKGIDSIFVEDGSIPVENYDSKLVSLTSDGASVNTGRISGLMTRFASERNWLVSIHCINHRVELAVKDALTETRFKEIDEFYQSNFNLLKNSGKIKSEIKMASEAQAIQHYTLPKMSGTRFIGHRRKALRVLLDLWPSFIMAYENVISDEKTIPETRAKVIGLLKKFKNFGILTLTCLYLDILEKTVPMSKVFEGERLLPFEIKSSVKETIADLSDYLDESYDDIDSHLQRFKPDYNSEGDAPILKSFYNSPNDKIKKKENRNPVLIVFPTDMTHVNEETICAGKKVRESAAQKIVNTLEQRFESLNENIFSLMNWCDPKNWTDEKDYGLDELTKFASHFEIPLAMTTYDSEKVRLEWRNFRRYVSLNLPGKEARILWKKILCYKRSDFPNICLLAEIMYCLSGSNSAVERGFSILTMMLSDRRLKTSHDLMNFRIVIKINDKNFNDHERSEILRRAVEIYLTKTRRKRKLDEPNSSLVVEVESDESDDDDSIIFSDDEYECF